MTNIRRLKWIIHRVRKIAGKNGVEPPANHLFNRERASEDAHIGVHAHEDDVLDSLVMEKIVDLLSIIADSICVSDLNDGMLSVPRFVGIGFAGV